MEFRPSSVLLIRSPVSLPFWACSGVSPGVSWPMGDAAAGSPLAATLVVSPAAAPVPEVAASVDPDSLPAGLAAEGFGLCEVLFFVLGGGAGGGVGAGSAFATTGAGSGAAGSV